MDIKREYSHKTFGEIGTVELTVPAEGWVLNGQPLSESSVRHLATFALQTLQDAYAGADDEAEALSSWEKKLDKLLSGSIGTREGGSRDPVKARMVSIAMRHVKTIKGADGKIDRKAMRAEADKILAKKGPLYRDLAESQIRAEKALGTYDPEGDDESGE